MAALLAACGGRTAAGPEGPLPENRPPADAGAVAAAPADASTPPPDPARSDAETVELAIELFDQMGRAAADSGACEPMARSLGAIAGANSDVWQRLAAIGADAERRSVIDDRSERLGQAATALAEAVGDCMSDPDVRRALGGIGGW